MKEITVEELKKKIDSKEPFLLLDVRESFEAHISSVDTDDSVLIPVDDIGNRTQEIDKSKEIIVMCRSGKRSAKACEILEENGFPNVANLKGGINEWALKIDPSLPQY